MNKRTKKQTNKFTYLPVILAQRKVYVVSNNTAGVEGPVLRRLQLLSSPQLQRPGNISSFVVHCGTCIWLFIRLSVSDSLKTHKECKKTNKTRLASTNAYILLFWTCTTLLKLPRSSWRKHFNPLTFLRTSSTLHSLTFPHNTNYMSWTTINENYLRVACWKRDRFFTAVHSVGTLYSQVVIRVIVVIATQSHWVVKVLR